MPLPPGFAVAQFVFCIFDQSLLTAPEYPDHYQQSSQHLHQIRVMIVLTKSHNRRSDGFVDKVQACSASRPQRSKVIRPIKEQQAAASQVAQLLP
jgi:hypothetical protein